MRFEDFFTHYGDPLREIMMNDRLNRKQFYEEQVKLYQRRSTCLRLQVGAIIIRDGRIISGGYNGAPSGMPHCSALVCGPDQPCIQTVHAEANAIAFAAKYGIATDRCSMWISDSPCNDCAKLIINAGITAVTFLRAYRDEAPVLLLHQAGINVKFYAQLAGDIRAYYGSTGQ